MSTKKSPYEGCFNLEVLNPTTLKFEFEGVFTSLTEISAYLEIPKKAVTAIANAEYEDIDPKYAVYAIEEVYSSREVMEDLQNFKTEQGVQ